MTPKTPRSPARSAAWSTSGPAPRPLARPRPANTSSGGPVSAQPPRAGGPVDANPQQRGAGQPGPGRFTTARRGKAPATGPATGPVQTIRLAVPAHTVKPRPALDFIRSHALFEMAERMMALEQDLKQIQPTLRLKPVKLDRQVLIVTAPSAAVGARLRQFEPSLLAGLRARGWLVNRLRFRAQMAAADLAAQAAARQAQARPKAAIGAASLAALEALHRETVAREGERGPFATALARFIERQRSYRLGDG